jgi:putative oxidoreductase
MNLALWVVQGILVFLMAGGMKVFAYEKYKKMTESKSPTQSLGLSKGLVTFIGISELAGAAGLILPLATGIAPVLTTLAALGLATIMLLASIYHLRRKEPPTVIIVLLLLASFVVYGRAFS